MSTTERRAFDVFVLLSHLLAKCFYDRPGPLRLSQSVEDHDLGREDNDPVYELCAVAFEEPERSLESISSPERVAVDLIDPGSDGQPDGFDPVQTSLTSELCGPINELRSVCALTLCLA